MGYNLYLSGGWDSFSFLLNSRKFTARIKSHTAARGESAVALHVGPVMLRFSLSIAVQKVSSQEKRSRWSARR